MRALVINLDHATARLEFMAAQFQALGIAWERLAAVTPQTLQPPPGDPHWELWERPLRQAEMAVAASHMAAWAKVAASGQPWLICEDDALLSARLPKVLAAVSGLRHVDHLSLETRGRKKLLGPAHPTAPIRRLWQDRSGAAAYISWPMGAEALLRRAARGPGLADAMICAAYELRAYQAVPALAIQLDQAAQWGLVPPIAVTSQIDAEPKPPAGGAHRWRRLRAQARMGLRQMLRAPGAARAMVAPEGPWPGLGHHPPT